MNNLHAIYLLKTTYFVFRMSETMLGQHLTTKILFLTKVVHFWQHFQKSPIPCQKNPANNIESPDPRKLKNDIFEEGFGCFPVRIFYFKKLRNYEIPSRTTQSMMNMSFDRNSFLGKKEKNVFVNCGCLSMLQVYSFNKSCLDQQDICTNQHFIAP